METKGIIISQKDYERLTDIEKNFDAKVEEKLRTKEKDCYTYKEIIETQKRTIRNLWWAFGVMFVAWIIMSIAYITTRI